MPTRTLDGRIAKLSLNDSSLTFFIGDDPGSCYVSAADRQYASHAAAIFIAAANNLPVSVKTDTEGRKVSLLTVEA
jgi:hypothetical protein